MPASLMVAITRVIGGSVPKVSGRVVWATVVPSGIVAVMGMGSVEVPVVVLLRGT